MNQEQLHSMEPLWNHWYVEELLGEGSFGSVYRIKREDFGEVQYAALKVIGVPQTEQQVRQCFAEGLGEEEVWQYFEYMVEEVYQEVTLMEQLKGKSNIVSYEDHEIRKRTEGIGYDILIRMELLTSLEEYLAKKSMTREEVIHMGKDLCQALCVCGRHNIIHRDIKPANIFISRDGDFKLGDFGIARRMQECPKDLSIKGSYTYMAPEVYLGSTYDRRVDIYSLGIVLYTYLNHKNIPFIQEHITYESKTQAIKRRLKGEKVPKLSNVPALLADAIEKAVAYLPEERFYSPEEFLLALEKSEKYSDKLTISEVAINKTVALASNPEKETEERRICKKNNTENKIGLCKKEQRSYWNQLCVHAMTAILFLLFGGALLFVGVEGFSNLHFTSHTEEKKNKAESVYAKEEEGLKKEEIPKENKENMSTPAVTIIPIKNRKIIKKNNSDVKKIQEVLKKSKCSIEEVGELYLSGNKLIDIKELTGAENLYILDISGNEISDFSPLGNLQELTICNATGNPMKNLSWIAGKEQLVSLWIGSTGVEDLEQIVSLSQLQDLHMENTRISNLVPLQKCKNLTQLDCRNCKNINSIVPLLELTNLQYVCLEDTNVSENEVKCLYQQMKKKNPDAYLIDVDGRECTG